MATVHAQFSRTFISGLEPHALEDLFVVVARKYNRAQKVREDWWAAHNAAIETWGRGADMTRKLWLRARLRIAAASTVYGLWSQVADEMLRRNLRWPKEAYAD